MLSGKWVLHHDNSPSHSGFCPGVSGSSRSSKKKKVVLRTPPHTYHIFMWLHSLPYQEIASPWITFEIMEEIQKVAVVVQNNL
jgi:hypothetical protein